MIPQIMSIKEKVNAKKGQALVELAVFSSLFLFTLAMLIQYGLNFNYQQEHNMRVFRQALDQAASAGEHAQQGSVMLLNDRAYPDPQDNLSIPQHYPVSASAGVLWSNKLQGRLEYGLDEGTGKMKDDRPRLVMQVNNLPIEGSNEEGQVLTAGYKEMSLLPTDMVRKLKQNEPVCNGMDCQNSTDIYPSSGSWEWQDISLDMGDVNVREPECATSTDPNCRDPGYAGHPEDGHYVNTILDKANKDLDIGSSGEADVDNDGKAEIVLPLNSGDIAWIDQNTTVDDGSHTYKVYKYYVNRLRVFDRQEGVIDLTYDSRDENAGAKPQGIQPGYIRNMQVTASSSNQDNWLEPGVVKSTSDIYSKETISRGLLLNNPGGAALERTVRTDFETSTEEEWGTNND